MYNFCIMRSKPFHAEYLKDLTVKYKNNLQWGGCPTMASCSSWRLQGIQHLCVQNEPCGTSSVTLEATKDQLSSQYFKDYFLRRGWSWHRCSTKRIPDRSEFLYFFTW